MKKLLLSLLIVLSINFMTAQPTCQPPTSVLLSNISESSVVIGWTMGMPADLWEIYIVPAGTPAPTAGNVGQYSTVNPYFFNGLNCSSVYNVYVRTDCSTTDISTWAGPFVFTTGACMGQPQDMMECVNESTGLACFDINANDPFVLGTLNPSDYTVSYHLTQSDANSNSNPIDTSTDYCFSTGTAAWAMIPIFTRLTEIANGQFWIYNFNLSAQTALTTEALNPMVQCDEDNDGSVVFDLTSAEAQINTTNPLAYYLNIEDAIAMVNAIPDPTQYSTFTINPLSTIFIREIVIGDCDNIYPLPLNAMANCNVANVCIGANSLCNSLGIPFSNTVNVPNAEPGNEYACLGSQPNPTWFFLPVSEAGTINLIIQQSVDIDVTSPSLDVDYICYGPFTNPTNPCSGMLTNANVVGCSFSTSATEYASIPNAQPGQFYLIMVTNFSNMPGYIKISEDSGSQGAIDCSGLRLNAFLDSNSNGVKDTGESNFPLGQFTYERNNDGDIHNIISPSGIYNIYDVDPTNIYDVSFSIDTAYGGYYALTTASYSNLSVVAGAGLQEYYFPVTITNSYNDLSVSVIPNQPPRPGFVYSNKVVYTNLGNLTVASGTVTFNKDPMVTIVGNTQLGTVDTPIGFYYDFADLQPFESRQMTVNMQVPTLPTVAIGDLLTNTATIAPLAGDISPENNSSSSTQTIIGAYDPNDKMESRGEQILITDFTNEDYLYYTIRFENTGNAHAINVSITDMLDAMLDETTLAMVSSSHDYVLDRQGKLLTWNFDNIFLPAINSGSPLPSNGYVHFKIKPYPGYAVGDIIPNTASIYFDFNPAIVTNTFNSEFVSVLATPSFAVSDFTMYPNPATEDLTIMVGTGETIRSIRLVDVLGKQILQQSSAIDADTMHLNISDLSSGIYVIEVLTGNQTKSRKKLIIQ